MKNKSNSNFYLRKWLLYLTLLTRCKFVLIKMLTILLQIFAPQIVQFLPKVKSPNTTEHTLYSVQPAVIMPSTMIHMPSKSAFHVESSRVMFALLPRYTPSKPFDLELPYNYCIKAKSSVNITNNCFQPSHSTFVPFTFLSMVPTLALVLAPSSPSPPTPMLALHKVSNSAPNLPPCQIKRPSSFLYHSYPSYPLCC